jgi:hypothetical protein
MAALETTRFARDRVKKETAREGVTPPRAAR